jgi:hypothetical protein
MAEPIGPKLAEGRDTEVYAYGTGNLHLTGF